MPQTRYELSHGGWVVRALMTGLDWKSANAPTVIHPYLEGNGSFAKTASAGQTLMRAPISGRPFFFCLFSLEHGFVSQFPESFGVACFEIRLSA